MWPARSRVDWVCFQRFGFISNKRVQPSKWHFFFNQIFFVKSPLRGPAPDGSRHSAVTRDHFHVCVCVRVRPTSPGYAITRSTHWLLLWTRSLMNETGGHCGKSLTRFFSLRELSHLWSRWWGCTEQLDKIQWKLKDSLSKRNWIHWSHIITDNILSNQCVKALSTWWCKKH